MTLSPDAPKNQLEVGAHNSIYNDPSGPSCECPAFYVFLPDPILTKTGQSYIQDLIFAHRNVL